MTNNLHVGRLTSGSWWFDHDSILIIDPLVRLYKRSNLVEGLLFRKEGNETPIIVAQIEFDNDRYPS